MSIETYKIVRCDGCDDEVYAAPTVKEARERAARGGWKRIGGRDYCPRCAIEVENERRDADPGTETR